MLVPIRFIDTQGKERFIATGIKAILDKSGTACPFTSEIQKRNWLQHINDSIVDFDKVSSYNNLPVADEILVISQLPYVVKGTVTIKGKTYNFSNENSKYTITPVETEEVADEVVDEVEEREEEVKDDDKSSTEVRDNIDSVDTSNKDADTEVIVEVSSDNDSSNSNTTKSGNSVGMTYGARHGAKLGLKFKKRAAFEPKFSFGKQTQVNTAPQKTYPSRKQTKTESDDVDVSDDKEDASLEREITPSTPEYFKEPIHVIIDEDKSQNRSVKEPVQEKQSVSETVVAMVDAMDDPEEPIFKATSENFVAPTVVNHDEDEVETEVSDEPDEEEAKAKEILDKLPKNLLKSIPEYTSDPVDTDQLKEEGEIYCINNHWHKEGTWYCIDEYKSLRRVFFNSEDGHICSVGTKYFWNN